MERIVYSEEKMDKIKEKVQTMISIVAELEKEFPGRHFTLDGHLVGSIGEVMAAYFYGIELYRAGVEKHDGVKDGKEIQIKITQRDDVVISNKPGKPQYLIVLYLTKEGNVYEVYNGPGAKPWKESSEPDSHNNRHIRVNKLMELDAKVKSECRIESLNPIEKMQKGYKNKR